MFLFFQFHPRLIVSVELLVKNERNGKRRRCQDKKAQISTGWIHKKISFDTRINQLLSRKRRKKIVIFFQIQKKPRRRAQRQEGKRI